MTKPTDPVLPAPLTSPPTAELHVHIEGTLEPAAALAIAARNGIDLPAASVADLRAKYSFADLQSFLDLYYANVAGLRTDRDFYDLAVAYLDRARAANVRRAEIFFDPQTHLRNGVPLAAVVGGLTGALTESERTHGISTDLIPCFLRDLGPGDADDTLTALLGFRDAIIGVGLDSTEIGYPPGLFAAVYARAAAEGLHLVAHAGEEGDAGTVAATIEALHVERIDHGIRAADDPALVRRLAREQIPLTVCPLSNVALRAAPSLAEHPLPGLLAAGVLVTVNSDDPAYFGGYVDDNYRALHDEIDMTAYDLESLAVNSFAAAFIDDAHRSAWQQEVRDHFAAHRTA